MEFESPMDRKIYEMRSKNAFLITILNEIKSYSPNLDELILLKHICNLLDEHKIEYTKNEVRKAFNTFWNNQLDNRKYYLSWIGEHAVTKRSENESKIDVVVPEMALASICGINSCVEIVEKQLFLSECVNMPKTSLEPSNV